MLKSTSHVGSTRMFAGLLDEFKVDLTFEQEQRLY